MLSDTQGPFEKGVQSERKESAPLRANTSFKCTPLLTSGWEGDVEQKQFLKETPPLQVYTFTLKQKNCLLPIGPLKGDYSKRKEN